jgi:iron complex transport system permease protein
MAVGTATIPISDILNILLSKIPGLEPLISSTYPPSWEKIILEVRLPRVLLGAFVGASLAVAGTSMQGLFRNPMADPFVIGISSGAALGAVITLPMETVLLKTGAHYVAPFFAFAGALGAVLLVYSISRVGGKLPVETLLLAGVAVASFLSAVTYVVVYAYSSDIMSVLFWLTGSLGAAKWIDINVVFPACVLGTAILLSFARDLNGIMLGEETARHLGIEAERVKKIILVVSSFVTAAAVVTSGTIGFVGLVTPHVMRLIVGPDHRILIPSSAIVGGIFLIWCDTITKTLVGVPVAMVTALFGAPFFTYLLWRRKRSP